MKAITLTQEEALKILQAVDCCDLHFCFEVEPVLRAEVREASTILHSAIRKGAERV